MEGQTLYQSLRDLKLQSFATVFKMSYSAFMSLGRRPWIVLLVYLFFSPESGACSLSLMDIRLKLLNAQEVFASVPATVRSIQIDREGRYLLAEGPRFLVLRDRLEAREWRFSTSEKEISFLSEAGWLVRRASPKLMHVVHFSDLDKITSRIHQGSARAWFGQFSLSSSEVVRSLALSKDGEALAYTVADGSLTNSNRSSFSQLKTSLTAPDKLKINRPYQAKWSRDLSRAFLLQDGKLWMLQPASVGTPVDSVLGVVDFEVSPDAQKLFVLESRSIRILQWRRAGRWELVNPHLSKMIVDPIFDHITLTRDGKNLLLRLRETFEWEAFSAHDLSYLGPIKTSSGLTHFKSLVSTEFGDLFGLGEHGMIYRLQMEGPQMEASVLSE